MKLQRRLLLSFFSLCTSANAIFDDFVCAERSVLIFTFSPIYMCKLPCKRFNICFPDFLHAFVTITIERFALFIKFKIFIGFLSVLLIESGVIFLCFAIAVWTIIISNEKEEKKNEHKPLVSVCLCVCAAFFVI